MTQPGPIHIGTSGWAYAHWQGPFYPPDLGPDERLGFYARRLDTVEVNRTFYSLPRPRAVAAWRRATPEGFRFAVKASRYLTHMKKLKDPDEAIANLFAAIAPLGPRLGPVLFQLPPRWRRNSDRLEAFLAALPPGHTYACEFRDPSWFHDQVYQVLRDREAAFCIYDLAGSQSPREVTARTVYIRLHGPSDQAYQGSYDAQALAGWAGAISAWSRAGREVWCFFDNDQAGHAAQDALRLAGMLGQGGAD